jgi:predicted dehydrogenase
LVIVADVDLDRAKSLAGAMGCQATSHWEEVVSRDDVDAIIVSTPNKYLMPITLAALGNGKHVLCEKPPGRNPDEAHRMAEAAQRAKRVLKIGFNHRHHPAIWKAHELYTQGVIGPLFFIRAVYGHGGRPGYDREWRADPDLAGGGELLDQGVHIVDLCRWFMGNFATVYGITSTCFWNLGCFSRIEANRLPAIPNQQSQIRNQNQLEDNAFILMRTAKGQVAQWHTSWTQWKNRFSFEIFGSDGYLRVEGLGGSYGTETLTMGYRRPESGPPMEEHLEFPGPDPSWQAEWTEFVNAIREGRQPMANGEEGLETMRLISAIYESAHTGQVIRL